MENESKRLVNNIKYYTIGVFSTRILAFLFIPIYSIYINPEILGQFQYLNSILLLIVPVLYQSIWEGMFRYSIVSKGREIEVINTTTKYCLGLTSIYVFIYFIFVIVYDLEYPIYIFLCGLSQMTISYWQFAARALKENKTYTLSTIVCSAITLLSNVVLIIVFRLQIDALFISFIAGSFGGVAILEWKLHLLKKSRVSIINKELLITIIKYSIPLSVNSISWWLISSCNNIVVTNALGESSNGILAMAQRFGSIFALMTSIIAMAWQEESFRTLYNDDRDAYFNKILNLYTKALFSAVCVLIPLTFILYQLMVFGEYRRGVAVVSMLYIIGALNAIITHLGSAFLAKGESFVMFWTTLLAGILTVSLSILLIGKFGLMGVMVATIISCIINFIIRVILLNKKIMLDCNYFQLVFFLVLSIVVSCLCEYIGFNFVLQVSIFAVLIIITVLLNKSIIKPVFCKILKR